MTFDIAGAKQAGYSDADIADYLASQNKFDAAGARNAGYSDSDIVGHLTDAPDTGSFTRQLGLTARAGLGGLGSIANIALDPAVALINKGLAAAQPTTLSDLVTGAKPYQLPIPSQAMERTLSRFLPTPATPTERIAQAGARAMIPAAGSVALGRAIPLLAPLAQSPGLQLASGAGAGASSQGAAELGLGPAAQAGAGLLGGVAGPTALAAAAAAARAAMRVPGSLIAPLTQNGQMNTAARIFQQSATSPQSALENIQNAPQYVPGVTPSTASVANDSGISALYKTLKNQAPAQFANAETANDAARQAFLAQNFGAPADVIAAKAARDATTTPMREAAFANAGPVDTAPIVQAGTDALEAGAKYRGPLGATLQKFVNDISQISDPQILYNGPRKAINDAIYGKVSNDSPLAQFTKQELIALRNQIDSQIEGVAPGFKQYLQTHAGLSRQIDAQQLGQDITQSATNPMTENLSPAKFARQVQSNGPEIAQAGARPSDALMRVNEDLKRSAAPMNTMRTAGSDTTQNLVGDQLLQSMLGRLPGGAASKVVSKLASFAYSPAEARIRQMLVSGQLDPTMGAALLGRKIPIKPDLVGGLLGQLLPISYGGLLGSMSANQGLRQ